MENNEIENLKRLLRTKEYVETALLLLKSLETSEDSKEKIVLDVVEELLHPLEIDKQHITLILKNVKVSLVRKIELLIDNELLVTDASKAKGLEKIAFILNGDSEKHGVKQWSLKLLQIYSAQLSFESRVNLSTAKKIFGI